MKTHNVSAMMKLVREMTSSPGSSVMQLVVPLLGTTEVVTTVFVFVVVGAAVTTLVTKVAVIVGIVVIVLDICGSAPDGMGPASNSSKPVCVIAVPITMQEMGGRTTPPGQPGVNKIMEI